MPSNLGLLELECDAPSYPIVRACRKLGMKAPEDVRWCRITRFQRRGHGWMRFLAGRTLGRLFGKHGSEAEVCTCGHTLPNLEGYSFAFSTGEQMDYQLGQCPRCRTIFWDNI
jgi:hypothetical protein